MPQVEDKPAAVFEGRENIVEVCRAERRLERAVVDVANTIVCECGVIHAAHITGVGEVVAMEVGVVADGVALIPRAACRYVEGRVEVHMPVVEVVEHLFHQVEELEMGVLGVGVDGLGAGDIGRAEGVPVNIFLLYKTVFLVDNLP